METSQEKTIDNIKDDSVVTFIATVKSRTAVRNWSRHKTAGKMMTGLLSDKTGTIDFVCWTDGCSKFDTILKQNMTFNISNAKVVLAKETYSKSKHLYQIVFDQNTEIAEVKCEPLIAPITITPISSLLTFQNHSKVNVVGKITAVPPPEKLANTGTDIIKCRIQDNTGTIQLSLLGQEIHKCNFNLNDTVLLENVEIRVYGILRVLQGNTGWRTVNPVDRDYSPYMPTPQTTNIDLSPPKNVPKEKTISTLNKDDGRQKFQCPVLEINISDCLYDKCPKVTCRTRVVEMNNGTFKCNNCEVEYLVSSLGIRLILEITKEDKISKKLLMFNEMAERFLEISAKELSNMDEDKVVSYRRYLLSRNYSFTAGPAKQPNEYLIESFEVIGDSVNDIKKQNMTIQPSQSPLGTSVTHQTTVTEERGPSSKPHEPVNEMPTLSTSNKRTTLFKPYALEDMPSSSEQQKPPPLFQSYPFETPTKPEFNANTQGHFQTTFSKPYALEDMPSSSGQQNPPPLFQPYPFETPTKLDINANTQGHIQPTFNMTLDDNDMEDIAPINLSTIKQDEPPKKKYKFVRSLFN